MTKMARSAIQRRLTRQLRSKGKKNAASLADALLAKAGILRKGKLTKKGQKRNKMTPAQRAKSRGAKYSKGKHKASSYKYNKKTNRVRLKRAKKS